jgi:hypothetical protein
MSELTYICSKCKVEKPLSEFHKDRRKKLGIRSSCKVCHNKTAGSYRGRNRDLLNEKQRLYSYENKEQIKEYFNMYRTKRYNEDTAFRILECLRGRVRWAINHGSKSASTVELVGCTVEVLRDHLESQFTEGMTWDNHSYEGWHMDHIRPCASFDMEDPIQQKECWHYTNLQPLWAFDNMSKGSKV